MAVTRSARAATAAGAAADTEDTNIEDARGTTRSNRGRVRSISSARGRRSTAARTKESQQGDDGCSKTSTKCGDKSSSSNNRRHGDNSSSNETNSSSSASDSNTSSDLRNSSSKEPVTTSSSIVSNSSSTTSSTLTSSVAAPPAAAAMPRVTLSLLMRRPPVPAPTSGAPGKNEGRKGPPPAKDSTEQVPMPAVFSRLSLGSKTPEPLLRPLRKAAGGEGPSAERTFLDTTGAPGVVTLRPLEPAEGPTPFRSQSINSMSLGRTEKESSLRDGRKIAEAVAAGEGPPKVTDAVLQQGPLRGAPLPAPDLQVLRKAEREQKRDKEKKQLSGWFGMPLVEISPHLLRELRVLQLRGHADAKTFGAKTKGALVPIHKEKRKDGGPPTHTAYLQVARVVNGGLRGVGGGAESQAAGTANKGPGRRGGPTSLLHSLLNDPEVHRWTKRKYREIQHRNNNKHSAGWSYSSQKKKRKS